MTARLYIDLNHWIELAKARKAGDLSLEARLARLVEDGKVIIPVSAIHMLEISAILKEHQRQDLSAMLRALSRGAVLRSFDNVRYAELEARIGSHYGLPVPQDIRPFIVALGYYRAFGELRIDFTAWRSIDPQKSADAEAEVWNQLNDEELLDSMLSLYSPKISRDGAEAEAIRVGLDQTRTTTRGLDLEEMEKDCVMGLARDVAELAVRVAADLKLSNEALATNPPVHFWTKEYLATIPTVNVWAKLYLYLARGMTREMSVNDLYDMGHLAVAVPYCDIVVTDRAMAHLLTFRGLHETYGTKIYAALEDCVNDLESSSCAK